jgi:hypothetical protein
VELIAAAIHVVRGHRVTLDADLAALYGVSNKRLNEQVKRNRGRFPVDFMFRLSASEAIHLEVAFCDFKSWLRRSPPAPRKPIGLKGLPASSA